MQATNRILLSFHEENQKLSQSILGQYLRSKIKEFGNLNNIRLQSLFDSMAKLQEEYFIVEGEGRDRKIKHETPPPIDGSEQQPVAVMQEGKTREEFENKWAELMNREVTIEI